MGLVNNHVAKMMSTGAWVEISHLGSGVLVQPVWLGPFGSVVLAYWSWAECFESWQVGRLASWQVVDPSTQQAPSSARGLAFD
jgi:hypothetical protein